MSRKKAHNTMNEDIKKYPIFMLTPSGKLKQYNGINSTNDYNHATMHLHHFIPKSDYIKNEQWYKDRGINQFLILLPVCIHEQIHGIGTKILSDEDFKTFCNISKWELIFNRKYSKY